MKKTFAFIALMLVMALLVAPNTRAQDLGTKTINTTNYTLVQYPVYTFDAGVDSAALEIAHSDSLNTRVLVQAGMNVNGTWVYSDTAKVLIADAAEYFMTAKAGITIIPFFKIRNAFVQAVPSSCRITLVTDATDSAYRNNVKVHLRWRLYK